MRDLWVQKEVSDGKLVVEKVPGEENPADLMTKVLTVREIKSRLSSMNVERVSIIMGLNLRVQALANVRVMPL
eukprot:449303-Karenia_brevis.AAC.1